MSVYADDEQGLEAEVDGHERYAKGDCAGCAYNDGHLDGVADALGWKREPQLTSSACVEECEHGAASEPDTVAEAERRASDPTSEGSEAERAKARKGACADCRCGGEEGLACEEGDELRGAFSKNETVAAWCRGYHAGHEDAATLVPLKWRFEKDDPTRLVLSIAPGISAVSVAFEEE